MDTLQHLRVYCSNANPCFQISVEAEETRLSLDRHGGMTEMQYGSLTIRPLSRAKDYKQNERALVQHPEIEKSE